MLIEQGPQPIYLDLKCNADSLTQKLYIYYNQHQWLGVNFGLTDEYGELCFMILLWDCCYSLKLPHVQVNKITFQLL